MAKWANNEIIAERHALLKRVEELKKVEMTREQKRQVCEESPYLHVTAKTVWCKLPAELKKSMNWILNDERRDSRVALVRSIAGCASSAY